MPQRQRHMVQIDAQRYPELAGLLWTAGFGQKSQLMLDLLEAGRRHLLKEQHKRSGRSQSGLNGLGSGEQQPVSRPAITVTTPATTTLPSPPAEDIAGASPPASESEVPPNLGVLKSFLG